MPGLTEWTVGVVHVAINYVATINDFRCQQIKWSRTRNICPIFKLKGSASVRCTAVMYVLPFFECENRNADLTPWNSALDLNGLNYVLLDVAINKQLPSGTGRQSIIEFSGMRKSFLLLKFEDRLWRVFKCIHLLPSYRSFLFYLNILFISI